MTKKRNSLVYTSPGLKKQKSPVQKEPLQRMTRKKTLEPKFLLRLKRFLIQRNQEMKVHKRKSGENGTVSSTSKSRLSASSDDKRKRKSLAESPPVLPNQASAERNRKCKSPVNKSPPVLSIQISGDCIRKRKFPAKSPPVLAIQASNDCIRKRKSPAESPPVLAIQDQSAQPWEQVGFDLSQVTTTPRPVPHMIGKKKILRESNAVSPAIFMPAPSQSANVPVGFDRNLEPLKIVKMAELRGKDYFLMKWKGSEIMDIVPTKFANERCPQVVIEFYEKHLRNVHNRDMDSYE